MKITTRQRPKYKRPVDVFPYCPSCETKELLRFDGELFCLKCPWDSLALSAEAIVGYRHLFTVPHNNHKTDQPNTEIEVEVPNSFRDHSVA
jgi:hypothetical protein